MWELHWQLSKTKPICRLLPLLGHSSPLKCCIQLSISQGSIPVRTNFATKVAFFFLSFFLPFLHTHRERQNDVIKILRILCSAALKGSRYTRWFYTFVVPVVHFFTSSLHILPRTSCTIMYLMYLYCTSFTPNVQRVQEVQLHCTSNTFIYPIPRGTQGMQVQVQDRTPCVPPVYPLHNLCIPHSVCVSRVQGVRKGYTRVFYTFVVPVVHFFTSSYCTPYLLYMYLMYP